MCSLVLLLNLCRRSNNFGSFTFIFCFTSFTSFEWDLDDELSELYLRKDMSRFWKNWQSRFSKRSLIPQHVNSADAHEIAEKFCMHFAARSFHSYFDDSDFTKLNSKLEGVQPP